jgi:hypothetical protein
LGIFRWRGSVKPKGGAGIIGAAGWRRAFIAILAYTFRPILSRDKVSFREGEACSAGVPTRACMKENRQQARMGTPALS